jgi:lysophospholipase
MRPSLSCRRAYPPSARIDTWHARDGWPIRRLVLEPEGACRGGLLLLNGRADMAEKYLEAACHWAERGWRVTSFDWRGQGGSGRLGKDERTGHVDDFVLWLDDLASFYSDLANRDGPPVVVAHSMGGHLLLRTLLKGSVIPPAAALVAPMFGLNTGHLPEALAYAAVAFMCRIGDPARSAWSHEGKSLGSDSVRQTVLTHSRDRFEDEQWWRETAPELSVGPPSWGWLKQAMLSCRRLQREARDGYQRTPLLILGAAADQLVSSGAIRKVTAHLPSARLNLYEQAAHEILREADEVREDAFARIDSFLDSQVRAP